MPEPIPANEPLRMEVTQHKAKWGAIWSAILGAFFTALVSTITASGAHIQIVWDWQWCDPTLTQGDLLCPGVSKTFALKQIVETLGKAWYLSLAAGGAIGVITGSVVAKTQNYVKEK